MTIVAVVVASTIAGGIGMWLEVQRLNRIVSRMRAGKLTPPAVRLCCL